MQVNAALAATATLVAGAFTLSTLDRWMRRRTAHDLAWTISLALFAVGSAALWWAESNGWNRANFRLFYLAGAVLNVPWLALGTVYLLGGRRRGDAVRTWLVALSGLATGVVLFAPMDNVVGAVMPAGKDVFGVAPRVLAAVGSGVAAVVIFAGALWSAYRVLRHGHAPGPRRRSISPGRLAAGNVLIAAGTVILSASGGLAGRLGKDRAFAVTLVTGVVVLFCGFLVAGVSPTRLHAAERPSGSDERAA